MRIAAHSSDSGSESSRSASHSADALDGQRIDCRDGDGWLHSCRCRDSARRLVGRRSTHATFAGGGYVTIVAMQLLAARALARSGRPKSGRVHRYRRDLAACLAASTLGPAHGLWQRLGLTTGDAWIVSAATAILCTPAVNRAPVTRRV